MLGIAEKDAVYVLDSTGEKITNVDLLTKWTIHENE